MTEQEIYYARKNAEHKADILLAKIKRENESSFFKGTMVLAAIGIFIATVMFNVPIVIASAIAIGVVGVLLP